MIKHKIAALLSVPLFALPTLNDCGSRQQSPSEPTGEPGSLGQAYKLTVTVCQKVHTNWLLNHHYGFVDQHGRSYELREYAVTLNKEGDQIRAGAPAVWERLREGRRYVIWGGFYPDGGGYVTAVKSKGEGSC